MKLTCNLLLIVFMVYYINYHRNNNDSLLLTKFKVVNYTWRQYCEKIKRRRRNKIYYGKNNSHYGYLLCLILLSGDVEINPGPDWNCNWCSQQFGNHRTRLENHQQKATRVSCNVCNENFCFKSRLQQHQRTEGHGLPTVKQTQRRLRSVTNKELTEKICPDTGYSDMAEYQECLDTNYDKIRTFTKMDSNMKVVNQQIPPTFTYGDLKSLLADVRSDEQHVFKINLGFGLILYHTITKTYRYFYVSSNHLLFDKAYTISTTYDMRDFYEKIVTLD